MSYIKEAIQTKSDQFHGDLVSRVVLMRALKDFSNAAQQLDNIKKTLFYGKENLSLFLHHTCDCEIVPALMLEDNQKAIDILHAIIGKATEDGELVDALLASINSESKDYLDLINVVEEMGDGQWYDAILANAVGVTFEQLQTTNIAKLRARYPNKFTEYDAQNRDLSEERRILEGKPVEQVFDPN